MITQHIKDCFIQATIESIAEAYYLLNTNKLMYSDETGWFFLNNNNTWTATENKNILKVPYIYTWISDTCEEIYRSIFENLNLEDHTMEIRESLNRALSLTQFANFVGDAAKLLTPYYYKENLNQLIYERQQYLFAFNNCVMDVRTFETRPIQPDDCIIVTCGYNYREPLPEEKEMVMNALQKTIPNPNVLRYLLQAVSTTFDFNNKNNFLHILYGRYNNGKSAFMDLCSNTFGQYSHVFNFGLLRSKLSNSNRSSMLMLYCLKTSRFISNNYAGFKLNSDTIKQLTNNTEVSSKGMYARLFSKYTPQFKIWIHTSSLPTFSSIDPVLRERVRLIHFPIEFTHEPRLDNEVLCDMYMRSKMRSEKPWAYGFLGLLIDAAKELRGGVIQVPQEVVDSTNAYLFG